jgi:hypothetical protein
LVLASLLPNMSEYAVESWTKLKPQREKSFSRKSTS